MLKLIKRKVNINNRRSSMEEEVFSNQPERESRVKPKKNLEDIYSTVAITLEDLNRRQTELEGKIESMEQKNDALAEVNEQVTEDLAEKKNYTNNLETLVLVILDQAARSKQEDGSSTSLNLTRNFLFNQDGSLSTLASSMGEEQKASIVKSLINLMIEEKCPQKNIQIFLQDKNNFSTECENENLNTKGLNDVREANNSYSMPRRDKFQELCETNVSSPTSLLSSNECIFNVNSMSSMRTYKHPLLSSKRKRTDESKDGLDLEAGSFDLSIKNKDSLFEEMTRLTPCLISSPTLSPKNKKSFQHSICLINLGHSNIFSTTQMLSNLTAEAFYIYSLQEKGERIVSNQLIN